MTALKISHKGLFGKALAGIFVMGVIFCPWAAKNSLGAERVELERSHRSRPEWVTRVPETDGEYLYFVGRGSGASSLEAAETDAAADAVRQIVTMIGVDGAFSYDRLRHEAGLLLQDRLTLTGSSPVVGLKRISTYYEKSTVTGSAEQRAYYDSHLLVRFPVGSLNEARVKLEQDATDRVRKAEYLFATGMVQEEAGKHRQACDSYREALCLLDGAPAAFGADPSRRGELRRALETAVFRTGLSSRFLAIETASGEQVTDRESIGKAVFSSLLEEGFIPSTETDISSVAPLPRLHAEYSGAETVRLEQGFWFSLWSASLRLVNPLSGEVILAGEYTAKGFGPDIERAGLDARRKMRLEIFPRFAREARERLDSLLGENSLTEEKLILAR